MNFTKSVHGPDVSFYQDDDLTPQKIDFQKMKEAGASFVLLRGGQNSWIDEDFRDYVAAVKTVGLPWGSYWFYDSRTNPESQAALWKIACGTDIPAVIAADLEESYNGAYKGETFWKRFIRALEVEFPTSRIIIYTADWWWSQQYVSDPAFFASYPLWVAGYPASGDPADVKLPYPWREKQAHLWQYTSKGNGPAYGVESLNIDLNYWNGIYDFEAFWGSPLPDPGEPPVTTKTLYFGYTKEPTKVFEGPKVNQIPPDILTNTYVEGETAPVPAAGSLNPVWLLIYKPRIGYINVGSLTELKTKIVTVPDPEPPPPTGLPVIHYERTETFRAQGYPDKTITTSFDWTPNA